MWDIVWVSPQWHRSVSDSRHFLLQAPQYCSRDSSVNISLPPDQHHISDDRKVPHFKREFPSPWTQKCGTLEHPKQTAEGTPPVVLWSVFSDRRSVTLHQSYVAQTSLCSSGTAVLSWREYLPHSTQYFCFLVTKPRFTVILVNDDLRILQISHSDIS